MAHLPIRALTLYKQGIGYFQRRGVVDDERVALLVSRDGLSDVLKSLDIVVHAGGPVQSVDYETPADKTQLLASLPVRLGDRAGLTDLLTSLRGSMVTAQLAGGDALEGRVVGVETPLPGNRQAPALVLQRENSLRVAPLSDLRETTRPRWRIWPGAGKPLIPSAPSPTSCIPR